MFYVFLADLANEYVEMKATPEDPLFFLNIDLHRET